MTDKYFVLYFDKDNEYLQHIEIYTKTKWGGYENSSSDIESYNYGYNAKVLELAEGANTINHCIDKLITENIKLEQERFSQNEYIAKLVDMI